MGTDLSCTHCGLPVPAAERSRDDADPFCCAGCRSVYALIHESGLERYYDLRDADPGRAPQSTGRTYAEYDDDSFQDRYVRGTPSGLRTTDLYLEGLHCAACVWLIEHGATFHGSCHIRVDYGRSRARVEWDPQVLPLSQIAQRLHALGYPTHPHRSGDAERAARQEDRALIWRVGLCGAVAGNVMAIAFALYGGTFHGIGDEYSNLFRWSSLLVATPAVVIGGGVFFRSAWRALRAGLPHMDQTIALGILAGFGSGAVNTVTGRGEIYFDSVTALIFLLLVGRLLQRRQQRRAALATELVSSMTPRRARLVDGDEIREVPIEAVTPGAIVEVRPGDPVPADGVVIQGSSSVDRSLLTGESRPEAVSVEDRVHAGTSNVTSPLRVRVETTGEATRVGQLMQLVDDCARRRARVVQLADRIASRFVPAVIGLAVVTYLGWLAVEPGRAVDHAVALLVVACPCALGLATPLAVSAAIAQAARQGFLLKGGDVVERLARGGRLWLDKTGTITEGRMTLVSWDGPERWKSAVAALEQSSGHPVARALREAGGNSRERVGTEVTVIAGSGIEGVVDGHRIRVGRLDYVSRHAFVPSDTSGRVRELAGQGLTPVVVAVEGIVVAVAGVGDRIRHDARDALARLERCGWELGILSGDHVDAVRRVGTDLGVRSDRLRGGATPEEKVGIVEASRGKVPVVMAGDGINDAAALAAADVGIAVEGGAEAAMTAADVYLGRSGLGRIADLVEGSRRAMSVIRRNLVFSLGYNVLGVGLAMAGLITPVAAAILMPLSSLTVVTSSYRARIFRARAQPDAPLAGPQAGRGVGRRETVPWR